MDDEEKISFSKSAGRASQSGLADFELHCFPDIAADEPARIRRCVPTEQDFQRIKYDKIRSNPTDKTSRPDVDSTCSLRRGSISTAQLNEQAYQKGFTEGWEKGMIEGENAWQAKAEKKIKPLLVSLQEVVLQLNNIRKETYQKIEKEAVELALAIARQIICKEITIDRKIVMDVAREALAKVEDPGRITIKLSPSDLQFLKETGSHLSDMVENIDNVTLESAENVQSGGCIIETDAGGIDARIEKQLQAVTESFQTAMEKTSVDDCLIGE